MQPAAALTLLKRSPIGRMNLSYFGGFLVKPGPTNVAFVTIRFQDLSAGRWKGPRFCNLEQLSFKIQFTEQNLEIENAFYIPSTRRGKLKRSQAVSEPKLHPKTRARMLTSSLARFEDLEHLVLRYGPDLGQGHLPFACLLFPLLLYGVAQNLQSGPLKL